ncbi:MAG: transketolase [Anaerolineaceae bacterium]|nr:transketolase [Anaerolineaceae bacterium]
MGNTNQFTEKALNTIRFLSADAIQKANSGHPGLPMGTAAMAYTIWMKHLRNNPQNPNWINRDRFVLSGGHGSMLLYSLLHLTGYDLSLDELKKFRQWGSLTPGHPEYGLTAGVDATTGPLGQGFANGVGMAIAEAHLAAEFNKPGHTIIDHYTYAIVTDGDLMEGVAAEAASLAGHLQLGKMIYLYDDNRISIDGSTELAFTEDRGKRFEAYGWQVQYVEDGNDIDSIDEAIIKAKADPRPSLIICRTHIGYGLPTKQDTSAAHGSPPGDEELDNAKRNMDWPVEPRFFIPKDVLAHFRTKLETGKKQESEWKAGLEKYKKEYSDQAADLIDRCEDKLPTDWNKSLPIFKEDAKGMATRKASGQVINAIANALPSLMGGSADLAPSNNTWIKDSLAFQKDSHAGRNMHFGVREHGMGAILNGMAYHKGLIPYGATFLVFSDYLRPAIRVAALSHLQTIWVLTHDSIGLGEDGPTHQPVEHLASLRIIPNVYVIRPADATEVSAAWKTAIERKNGPTVLALSRQNLPVFDNENDIVFEGVNKGAYVLKDFGDQEAELILIATGSEVSLAMETAKSLHEDGKSVRVVSMPCMEIFQKQDEAYISSVLPNNGVKRVAIEAGVSYGWHKWVGSEGLIISVDKFGASAPASILFEQYGFTVAKITEKINEYIK